jgi:NAD(P)-dependent dehydrogenase (short-subunit alcohol dehydrogenase family)/acyl carrier protein
MLGELVEAFESGSLKPLPRTVFSVRDAANAFRYMAQAKHVGKVVLRQDATRGSVRADGSYLVTGGLGGLGLTVARWLVEQGARHLVLLGRREPTAEARQAIAAMEAQGASVRVFQADVSRQEDIAHVLAEIERSMPPLRGVVHVAGVLDDGVLLQQDWERFQRVMAPKVEGAWNLHILTRHCPLDFFVLFSSMASLMGSPAQGNYAAANAFLDGLAWQRRSEGLPGLSINWGPWAEVGMVAGLRDQDQRRHAEKGVEPILPGDGARAFGQLLRDGASSQLMVAPIRWGRLLEQLPGRDVPAFLRNQARESSVATTASTCPAEGPPLLRRLEEAPIAQRRDLILGHVRELALKVLGLPASHPIDLRKPLSEMGLDSLMAVELRNAFSASFGTTFPATLLFDYPTIEDIAQHLGERFAGAPAGEAQEASSVVTEGRAKLLAEVRHLSDAEAESLIEKELGNLIPR